MAEYHRRAADETKKPKNTHKLVNLLMALCIMLLDMLELRCAAERLDVPVQLAQPLVQRGESGADVSDVTFEVLHVDGVEADDGGVEAHVGFGDVSAKVVGGVRSGGLGEVGFGAGE